MSTSYCVKCKRATQNINPRLTKTSNNKNLLLSQCPICGIQKSQFISDKAAKDGGFLLGPLGPIIRGLRRVVGKGKKTRKRRKS